MSAADVKTYLKDILIRDSLVIRELLLIFESK